jgi:hypothetical protein
MTILTFPNAPSNATHDSLPNRGNRRAVSAQVAPIGIDTIRISYRHAAGSLAFRSRTEYLDRESGDLRALHTTTSQVLPMSGVRFHTSDRFGRYCWFECSVPRHLRLSNDQPATLEEVFSAVSDIHAEASRYIDLGSRWTAGRVTRLDLVRDFHGVHDIGRVLDGLSKVRIPVRDRSRHLDSARGSAQALVVRTRGQWQITAYDKHTEMASALRRHHDPKSRSALLDAVERTRDIGLLRVETSLRDPLRKKFNLNHISDLTEDLMGEMAEHYFRRAGFDARVGGTAAVAEAIDHMSNDPAVGSKSDRVIAMLLRDALGCEQTASRKTLSDARRVALRYGLTAADFATPSPSQGVQLDWDSARLVEGEAS